jgi:hypothetical protein
MTDITVGMMQFIWQLLCKAAGHNRRPSNTGVRGETKPVGSEEERGLKQSGIGAQRV